MLAMKYKLFITSIFVVLMILPSCIQDKFDTPDITSIPIGEVLTIDQVRQMYVDSVILGPYATYKFTDDYSIYAVVTMDDKSGNIYKSAFIQDASGAINLHLKSSGGLYEGDSIRLYLKGVILGDYESMLQLDSIDVDKNIVKQATDRDRNPETVTIAQIGAGQHQAKLIKLENVQFVESDLNLTYADAENLLTENRTIEDCEGNQLIVRTSGYSSFADNEIPDGKGSIIGVLSQFRDEWQLYIRTMHEVNMDGLRCGEYISVIEENFDDVVNGEAISLEGWMNISSVGSAFWTGVNNGFDTMARISGNELTTSWLITPELNLNTYPDEKLSFVTRALNLNQANLSVWISTDYDGIGSPESATWVELSDAIIATGSSTTQSGAIDLSSYSGMAYIGFKYTCNTGGAGAIYLDNVVVYTE